MLGFTSIALSIALHASPALPVEPVTTLESTIAAGERPKVTDPPATPPKRPNAPPPGQPPRRPHAKPGPNHPPLPPGTPPKEKHGKPKNPKDGG